MTTKQERKDDARAMLNTATCEYEGAKRDLRGAIVTAVDAGVSKAEIARIVGVNESTVWRWLTVNQGKA